MKIDYQKLIFPNELQMFVREVINGAPPPSIPSSWSGILIYHPPTDQYYCTKSQNPLAYEEIVRLRIEPRWSDLAVALRKMLEHHHEFQFFILPVQARATLEKWLATQGKRRIATRMGEGSSTERALFKVYSPFNKVTRYVVAARNSSKAQIIEQANNSFAQWLQSTSRTHKHERDTMRVALRSLFNTNTEVFEKEAIITPTHLLACRTPNEFRAISMVMNIDAIRQFIQGTGSGNY